MEFLVTSDGHFYFLEMNPRLQVEHGVSELLTGRDIVELQLQSAAGAPFTIRQRDIHASGHAIEARVYPEDPDTCLPNVGVVTDAHLPEGDNVRVDTALCVGYEVSLHYEPLLAKVMAWGPDRDAAIATLDSALADFRLEGVKTNVPLLRDVLASPEFVSGGYHTGTLPAILERRRQNQGAKSNGHRNVSIGTDDTTPEASASGMDPRAVAAAIGVAAVYAAQGQGAPAGDDGSRWRTQGRRELFRSRLGSGSW